jgi:hypothetical protein
MVYQGASGDVIKAIAFGADIYVKRHRQYAKGLHRIG